MNNRTRTRTDVLIITCFAVVFVCALDSPVIQISVNNTMVMRAHAQTQVQQQGQDKLFTTLKVRSSNYSFSTKDSTIYNVYNITGNLQKLISLPQNETLQYNLNDSSVDTYSDKPVFFWIQGKITGKETTNSNPDVITQTQKDYVLISSSDQYTKQINKKTNTTTYTEQINLRPCLFCFPKLSNIDAKLTIYPNNTGIAELTQK